MAGDPKVEAGERAVCPTCGTEVMLHSMIPILAAPESGADPINVGNGNVGNVGNGGHRYVCVACARTLVNVNAGGSG